MHFPVYINLPWIGVRLHPHPTFELLGYIAGFTALMAARRHRRELRTAQDVSNTLWLSAAALVGAIIGAKLLNYAESPADYWQHRWIFTSWLEGKTIVGGLIGGWIAVEITKKLLRIAASTGDAWVLPLCLAIAIGRLGCFFTGLSDQTYGIHTALPWAVNFGDGPRHPTQLYESAFVLLLAIPLVLWSRRKPPPGTLFRGFILAYMAFRFFIEFLKPTYKPVGLSAIQIAAALTCLYILFFDFRVQRFLLANRRRAAPTLTEAPHA